MDRTNQISAEEVRLSASAPGVLSTLNADGSRRWLCPKPSEGRFLTRRRAVAWGLMAVFTLVPFVRVGGKPLLLLDVAERKFTILGTTFLPTDTVLLAVLLVGVFLTVFFVTAIFGRVWCGWACPQTVYLEFVFRPLERMLTGAPGRKKNRIQSGGLGGAIKYAAYLVISVYLAHTFLAYFVGVDRLLVWMQRSPLEHPGSFALVAGVTGLMMFDFAYFREQTCIVACPYGRFQSVMLDRSSLVVGYDRKRGEPRGKMSKRRVAETADTIAMPILGPSPATPSAEAGDCIDCRMCVTTCPTGIDIRDGLQMECVNCAQCIDACDSVMEKIGRPRGLVRYSSQAAMDGQAARIVRPRVVIYGLILTIIGGAFAVLLASREAADVTVLRGLGRPFTTLETGEIANPIRLKVVNRSERAMSLSVTAGGIEGVRIAAERSSIVVGPGESLAMPMMIAVPPGAFRGGSVAVRLVVEEGGGFRKSVPYRLMGPGSDGHRHDVEKSGDESEHAEANERSGDSR